MKTQSLKIASLLVLVSLSMFSFGQLSEEKGVVKSTKKQEVKEVVRKTQLSLFPFLVAGSISIIQKVYLKKAE